MTREPYPVVGEAMRKSIELAIASNITKADWKVLAAVHYAVTSWSRLEDRASLAQIALAMGDVEHRLVVRVRVDGGHEAVLDAEGIHEDLGHRSEAVRGARAVRDDVVLG